MYAEKFGLEMDIQAIQENENESIILSPNNDKVHKRTGKTLQERFANDGFSDISTIKNAQ